MSACNRFESFAIRAIYDGVAGKYVIHKGLYFYPVAFADGKLTFTSIHGLSPFTFSAEQPVLEIDGSYYRELQAAIDDIKDGDTLIVSGTYEGDAAVLNMNDADSMEFTVRIEDGVRFAIEDLITIDGNYYIDFDPSNVTKGIAKVTVSIARGHTITDNTGANANGI